MTPGEEGQGHPHYENAARDENARDRTGVCAALLAHAGVDVDEGVEGKLAQFVALVREWNDYASLVSSGDMDRLWERHLPDSLSLASYIEGLCRKDGTWLDVGSGGGFPLIPVALALPGLRAVAVERSIKAAGFLRHAVHALGLEHVSVVEGEFPQAVAGMPVAAITARAVERQGKILRGARSFLGAGTVFLCQSDKAAEAARTGKQVFHVEQIHDDWGKRGLRRGSLYLISCP